MEKRVDYQAQWKKNKGKVKIEVEDLGIEELSSKEIEELKQGKVKAVQRLGRIELRISEVEHELIKQKADEEGISVALYMKQKALGKKLPKRVNSRDTKKVEKVLKLVSK